MLTAVNIRKAAAADMRLMLAVERASVTAAHWTEHQYQRLFSADQAAPPRLALVAEPADPSPSADTTLLGFLIASRVAADWELENIVVAPTARRNGLGKRLLDALLEAANETNSDAVFLEVRESNLAARRLYERAGFHASGRRKSYYSNPLEDAVLYRRGLRG